ncbi:MAG TPA: fumarylacetoacetate hydrolase family protein [Acidimicrobiia bacterium]|nr:fumarylacetoacetate hydrolase family protein [Acidimicrobiia bacterium]
MRWVAYRHPEAGERAGVVVDDAIHAAPAGVTIEGLLRTGGGDALDAAGSAARSNPAEVRRLDEVSFLPPVRRPPSIRDFYAFEAHVKTARERRGLEMDPDWYELPVFYFTNPHVVVGPDEPVAVPPGCEWLDYELEVAAVLGHGGSDLDAEDGEAAIAGFTIMNDWSARDLQAREMRQGLGPAKGKDFATSLGPFLVTVDELADRRAGKAYDLAMMATVNGRPYSKGLLSDLHWSFGEMVAYASRGSRVEPGDVIGSGTVGTGCILELSLVHGSDEYPWLQPGDEVTLEVDVLGALTNRVVDRGELGPRSSA